MVSLIERCKLVVVWLGTGRLSGQGYIASWLVPVLDNLQYFSLEAARDLNFMAFMVPAHRGFALFTHLVGSNQAKNTVVELVGFALFQLQNDGPLQ